MSSDWYVKEMKVAKREELLMLRLMQAAGNGVRLMLKPAKVQGMKMQQICGLADNELQLAATIKKLVYGYSMEWGGVTRMVITGRMTFCRSRGCRRVPRAWQLTGRRAWSLT